MSAGVTVTSRWIIGWLLSIAESGEIVSVAPPTIRQTPRSGHGRVAAQRTYRDRRRRRRSFGSAAVQEATRIARSDLPMRLAIVPGATSDGSSRSRCIVKATCRLRLFRRVEVP